jgi:hypothetical protein
MFPEAYVNDGRELINESWSGLPTSALERLC